MLPDTCLHRLRKKLSSAALLCLLAKSQPGDAPGRGKSPGGCRFMASGRQGPAFLRADFWLVGPSCFQPTFTPKSIPTGCLSLLAGPDPTTHQSPHVLSHGSGLSTHMSIPSPARPHCSRHLLFSILLAGRDVSPDATSPFLASPTAPITAALRLSLAQNTPSPAHQPLQHLAWFNSF